MTILIDAQKIALSRSDRVLFSDLSVTVTDKDKLGVVGINGTGKSSLLRVLAGQEPPEGGKVHRSSNLRVAYLDQAGTLPDKTVAEFVGSTWQGQAILDRLGMSRFIERRSTELSGGQAKRVALAAVLLKEADLLILDEPTNHLDLAAITWLESYLAKFNGGLVVVTHDRYLLDKVTTRILELDRGRSYTHEGGYATYLTAASEREERSLVTEAVRKNLARRELAWLRRGVKARTRKPQARIDAARKLLESKSEPPARSTALDLTYDTPRLGTKVIEAVEVVFQHNGEDKPLLERFTLRLTPFERLGIVGRNGSGKTTLLELLAGRLRPSQGTIEFGSTVKIGYYTQIETEIDSNLRVIEVVSGHRGTTLSPSDKRLLESFWFGGELPWARVGTLSGGERRRLQLLKVLSQRPNVLLLDEPTNDLDLDTLRSLEEYLEDWPGTLVTVSHDRTFLERITTRVVACQDGEVREISGGLATWLSQAINIKDPDPKGEDSSSSKSQPPQRTKTQKSLSTLQFQLNKLDRQIAELTAKRDNILIQFNETTDHNELARLGNELTSLQSDLTEVEDRWLKTLEAIEGYGQY